MRLLIKTGLLLLAMFFFVVSSFGALTAWHGFRMPPPVYVFQGFLFMLAGASGGVACALKWEQLDRRYRQELDNQQFSGDRLEARLSIKTWASAAGAALMAFGTLYILFSHPPTERDTLIAAWVFILFGMFVVSAIASMLRSGKSSLILDARGLDHVWYGPIPWDQVDGIYLRKIPVRGKPRRHSLALLVRQPGRYLTRGPWWFRLISNKRRNAASGTIEFSLTALNKPAVTIHKAAVALRKRVSPPPLFFWGPGMSDEAICSTHELESAFGRFDDIVLSMEQGQVSAELADQELQQVSKDIIRLIAKIEALQEQPKFFAKIAKLITHCSLARERR